MVTQCSTEAQEDLVLLEEQSEQENSDTEDASAEAISRYEQFREERIKENLKRMQKLGIFDLSLKLKSLKPTPNRPYTKKIPNVSSPLPPPGLVRRSSRLHNSTPVSYCEMPAVKKDKLLDGDDLLREEGSRPEVYTEEHEKLLGSTEMSWTLFVDGYGKDGKRIYDPVRGKTCHQCRQKTLGLRTHCSKCNLVQGQFCGDCLYMRYGENVIEANQNPNWICPACRGICNCSLCRQAKGWPPTGSLYRKISNLGYKSVAHYLVQTRRGNADSDENVGRKVPISAKRSLPFSDSEAAVVEDGLSKNLETDSLPEVCAIDDGFNGKVMDNSQPNVEFGVEDGKTAQDKGAEHRLEHALATQLKDVAASIMDREYIKNGFDCDKEEKADFQVDNALQKSSVKIEAASISKSIQSITYHNGLSTSDTLETGDVSDKKDFAVPENSPKSMQKPREISESAADSIAGRLRQRRKSNETDELHLSVRNIEDATLPDHVAGRLQQMASKSDVSEDLGFITANKTTINAEDATTPDCIPARLRKKQDKNDLVSTDGKCSRRAAKRAKVTVDADSVAGRLKMRRRA